MSEVRVDPLTGDVVVVAAGRQDRPDQPEGCPFCVGGIEAPELYDTRWFTNRWPPLPEGRAEVLLFSPEHDRTLATLGVDGVRRVVDLWAERTAAQAAHEDVAYVLLFENSRPEVGATIPHPHGQLYAFDEVPEFPRRELDPPTCRLCGLDVEERLVTRAGDWWAAVPYAPRWPYELLLAPDEHLVDLPSATDDQRDDLAAVLVDALRRLDRLFDAPMPYMLWIHQRPTDGGDWPAAHVHVHVAPILRRAGTSRYVAAGELGSGVWFDPVVPEDAAAHLRAATG